MFSWSLTQSSGTWYKSGRSERNFHQKNPGKPTTVYGKSPSIKNVRPPKPDYLDCRCTAIYASNQELEASVKIAIFGEEYYSNKYPRLREVFGVRHSKNFHFRQNLEPEQTGHFLVNEKHGLGSLLKNFGFPHKLQVYMA